MPSVQQVEPFSLVKDEVNAISERLLHSVASNIPKLNTAAEYFFRAGVQGKRLRPSLVMLMASALSPTPPAAEYLTVDTRPASEHPPELRRREQRIAEIAELIHVASLLHDDVIDDATTRRGIMSVNASLGNKLAILAGDFLLARASVSSASLKISEVVELFSNVLESLVAGEVMQVRDSVMEVTDHPWHVVMGSTVHVAASTAAVKQVVHGYMHHHGMQMVQSFMVKICG